MVERIELTLHELKLINQTIDMINDDNYVAILIVPRTLFNIFVVIDRFEDSLKISITTNINDLLKILNDTKCPQCGLFHYGYTYFAIYDDNIRIIKMSPYEAVNKLKLKQILEQLGVYIQ